MTEHRHRTLETARVRAELTVQDLWLRYVALGGSGDAFDLDGHLQGLLPLEAFEQDVLAQALNERFRELYQEALVPFSTPRTDPAVDGALRAVVAGLLAHPPVPPGPAVPDPPGT